MGVLHNIQPKDISFNVMLSVDDKSRLQDITARLNISAGQVVRLAIQNTWAMVVAQQPLCANGTPCLVPQMHANTSVGQMSQLTQPPQDNQPGEPK